MWCGTKYRIINNLRTFGSLGLRVGNIQLRMSTAIENDIEQDADEQDIHKNNKRHMVDENNEIPNKIQKTEEAQKIKKKNYAIMLGYFGKDYYGMQRNPGMKTIEEDLLTAMLKADVITQEAFENIRSIKFQRAARTDKGVSAARQVINLKLSKEVKPAEINQYLPNEIRVFGLKRVTKRFSSKLQCNARTYRYILPTYSFASEDVSFLQTSSEEEIDVEKRLEDLSTIDNKSYADYRLSPEMLDKINGIMKRFEGTHNFHNFTSKVRPLDPRANRYIINFSCINTFVSNNTEFATLEIKGQSFMLHQIRKMVATVIGIARNITTQDIIDEVFQTEKLYIPIAPSLGLSLDYVHYDHYNKRFGYDGIHEILEWDECEEEVQKFLNEFIVKHIVDTEITEKSMLNWLAALKPQNFTLREETVAL